ncbi:hypothetical protein GWN91_08400 [Candidatus Saccharibacteria bacterium]|nr:hypothetical protein [Candidatus Saccharibacteria bacterium]NIS39128.1 hypothetical protein [Candidatus Saccharibacteria bacterium]
MDTLNPKQRKRFYWYKFYGCGPRRMATYSEEKESAISQSLKLIKIKFNKFNADNM